MTTLAGLSIRSSRLPGTLCRGDAPEPVRFSRRYAGRKPQGQAALSQSAVAGEQRGPAPQEPAVYQPLDTGRIGIDEARDLQGLCGPEACVQVLERLGDRPGVCLVLPEIGDGPDGTVQRVGVDGSGGLDGVYERAPGAHVVRGLAEPASGLDQLVSIVEGYLDPLVLK